MNSHTPTDNLAAKFLKDFIESKKLERVEDIIVALKDTTRNRLKATITKSPFRVKLILIKNRLLLSKMA
jgi:nickel-dependent lactate racemase